eukprot:717993-Hanusia_phi.AAC.9
MEVSESSLKGRYDTWMKWCQMLDMMARLKMQPKVEEQGPKDRQRCTRVETTQMCRRWKDVSKQNEEVEEGSREDE